MKLLAGFAIGLLLVGMASAATINDFDLNLFDFDVTSYHYTDNGTNGVSTASGTSNGIGWSIFPTNLWSGRTTTNSSFNFTMLPILTDSLHISSNFTITFDRMVDSLLVALDNDNTNDSIDFGLVPVDYQCITLDTTQILLEVPAGGGLALFENIRSFTISHENTNFSDGFDLAFHAFASSPVPEPSTILLLGGGFLGLGWYGRKRKMNCHENFRHSPLS